MRQSAKLTNGERDDGKKRRRMRGGRKKNGRALENERPDSPG